MTYEEMEEKIKNSIKYKKDLIGQFYIVDVNRKSM